MLHFFCSSLFLYLLSFSSSYFDPQVGKAKGVLKNFLIEPFVPHKQVKHSLHIYHHSFYLYFHETNTKCVVKKHLLTVFVILTARCSGGGVLRLHLRHPGGRLRAVSPRGRGGCGRCGFQGQEAANWSG